MLLKDFVDVILRQDRANNTCRTISFKQVCKSVINTPYNFTG